MGGIEAGCDNQRHAGIGYGVGKLAKNDHAEDNGENHVGIAERGRARKIAQTQRRNHEHVARGQQHGGGSNHPKSNGGYRSSGQGIVELI